MITPMILEKQFVLEIASTSFNKTVKDTLQPYFLAISGKALIIFRCIYYYYVKTNVENVFAIYLKTNIQNFFVLVQFVCHTPQFKKLVFAFQSEIWIAQNLNFIVFEDFCLSLSWKYQVLQNFTLIRQDEDCLRADFKSEVWSQKTVSKYLKSRDMSSRRRYP